MKTGIQLFYDECEKRNLIINHGPDGIPSRDSTISDSQGNSMPLDMNRIASVWGGLVFFHNKPELAIETIVDLLQGQLNIKSIKN
jgi:hypothetical protein